MNVYLFSFNYAISLIFIVVVISAPQPFKQIKITCNDISNVLILKLIYRKTDARADREANRFKTAIDIHIEIIPDLDKPISARTAPCHLNAFNVKEQAAKKEKFIREKRGRIDFAKTHLNCT